VVYVVFVYAAVVFFCHSRSSVRNRFLLRAQDQNMTNGEFAFFTFQPFRSSETDQPWQPMRFGFGSYDDDDDEDIPRLRRAFAVMKQVLVIIVRSPTQADKNV